MHPKIVRLPRLPLTLFLHGSLARENRALSTEAQKNVIIKRKDLPAVESQISKEKVRKSIGP